MSGCLLWCGDMEANRRCKPQKYLTICLQYIFRFGSPSQGFSPPARCPVASAFSQLDNFFYSSETIMAARPHRQSGQDRSESGEESNKFIKQLAPLAPIFIACHFVWPAMTSQRSSAPQLHRLQCSWLPRVAQDVGHHPQWHMGIHRSVIETRLLVGTWVLIGLFILAPPDRCNQLHTMTPITPTARGGRHALFTSPAPKTLTYN